MTQATQSVASRPAWIDLSSSDPTASRHYYAGLFGWDIEVTPDPQYGGYGMARLGGKDVAGIGPKQAPYAPTAWNVYFGTENAEALAKTVQDAGGRVIAPPYDVGNQGRMAVFQDPTGAFFSVWQPTQMGGFAATGSNSFGWAELNARGIDKAIAFYRKVFGWQAKTSPGEQPYTEFQLTASASSAPWR